MGITTIGLDLAKNVFQVPPADPPWGQVFPWPSRAVATLPGPATSRSAYCDRTRPSAPQLRSQQLGVAQVVVGFIALTVAVAVIPTLAAPILVSSSLMETM